MLLRSKRRERALTICNARMMTSGRNPICSAFELRVHRHLDVVLHDGADRASVLGAFGQLAELRRVEARHLAFHRQLAGLDLESPAALRTEGDDAGGFELRRRLSRL